MSDPDANAAFCADFVRTHDFDRYASTLFVPADKRRALIALYAFNATIARIRDQVSQPLPGEVRLQWWTDALAGNGHGDVAANPVAAELLLTIRTHDLPIGRLGKLIEAHIFDLYNDPMPDLPLLENYLRDSESTLLLCAARILGATSPESDGVAEEGGLSLGLARIMSRLSVDAMRRQLFVPLDILITTGGSLEEMFARKATPAVSITLRNVCQLAKAHLSEAQALLQRTAPNARLAFLQLALVRHDLNRMAAASYQPFDPPYRTRLRTLWTLWQASRSAPFK